MAITSPATDAEAPPDLDGASNIFFVHDLVAASPPGVAIAETVVGASCVAHGRVSLSICSKNWLH